MSWIPITKEAYFENLKDNHANLSCFSSCTDSDYVLTEWGFKGTDKPYIKAIDVLLSDYDDIKEWKYSYFGWIEIPKVAMAGQIKRGDV